MVASDGIQHPPLQFPSGGMLQFLSCLETSVESNGGKFDPPLSTVQEEQSGKVPERVSSADPAKAKRRFPWTKKEASKLKTFLTKDPI